MTYYRLFILDHNDNLVTGVDIRSDSDAEALEWANFVLQPGRIGELWCGTRCVGRLTAGGPSGRGAPVYGLGFTQLPSEQGHRDASI